MEITAGLKAVRDTRFDVKIDFLLTGDYPGDGKAKPDVTLGVMPLGTANDFARGCELPTEDLTECLRIACTREGREIDVGTLNGRPFINVASLGFGAEITATTPVQLKKRSAVVRIP